VDLGIPARGYLI